MGNNTCNIINSYEDFDSVGWKTICDNSCTYKNGDSITPTGDTKLYPCFVKNGIIISEKIPIPTREGYTFEGWYTSPGCHGNKSNGIYKTWQKSSYYAGWSKNE